MTVIRSIAAMMIASAMTASPCRVFAEDAATDNPPITAPNAGLSLDPPQREPRMGQTIALQSGDSRRPAETATIRRTAHASQADSPTPWYRSGLTSLAVVLALIAVAAWAMRRFVTPAQSNGAEVLRVVCRTHLSPKQSIALVQMGGRFAFVGVTPDRITALRVVEDAQEAASLRTELRMKKRDRQAARFEAVFNDEAKRTAELVEPPIRPPGDAGHIAATRQELNCLMENLKAYRGKPAEQARRPANSQAA